MLQHLQVEDAQQRVTKPHPIIGRWLADRKARLEQSRDDLWARSVAKPSPLTATTRRRYRILDGLFKGLEKAGGKVSEPDYRHFAVDFDGEQIVFRVREKQKQVRRPLTADEKRWRLSNDRGWVQELQPIGKFVVEIKTYLPDGYRREWLETDDNPMEGLVADVVDTIVAAVPALVERTRQRVEAERQRQLDERRRYEAEQRRKRDDNRWRQLVDLARQWRDAELVRAYLEALKENEIPFDHEVSGIALREWLDWVDRRVQAADPRSHDPVAIFEAIASINEWSYRD